MLTAVATGPEHPGKDAHVREHVPKRLQAQNPVPITLILELRLGWTNTFRRRYVHEGRRGWGGGELRRQQGRPE